MAKAIVSKVTEQLASIVEKNKEVKLVVGVDDELGKLTSNFMTLQAVLDDAEERKISNHAVRDWLDELKNTSYDIDDVLDEWRTLMEKLQIKASKSMGKVCSLIPCYRFCFRLVGHRDIALKIKPLCKKIENIASEKTELNFSSTEDTIEPLTTSIIDDVSNFHGREHEVDTLLRMLLHESSEKPTQISTISIVGMAGIGKTALAKVVFNDKQLEAHFDKKIWVFVSHLFDEIRIAEAILKSLDLEVSKSDKWSEFQEISDSLKGRKFLLVLDHVWTENSNDWERLIDSLQGSYYGSRILVTTRKRSVAEKLGTTKPILLETLSEKDSWLIFNQIAFSGRTDKEDRKLENIAKEIVSKCKGLPLALKILGNHLRLKNVEEWQSILDNKLLGVEKVETELLSLLFYYFDSPFLLKRCLLYCATFPKDFEIEKDRLISLWMAQGYLREEQTKDMELIGEEYFETLSKYSFKDFKTNIFDGGIESCKMHDLQGFSQFLTESEGFTQEIGDFEESRVQLSCKRSTRNLALGLERGELFPLHIDNGDNIHSLVVRCKYNMNSKTLSKLSGDFTCLRILDLSTNCDLNVRTLPREIKKWIHLRYLDLSRSLWLKELPEVLCELFNLQTLNLNGCVALVKLPQGMGKLVNLRHLMNECTHRGLSYLPKGIERLTCLRTLKEFIVGRNRQGDRAGLECFLNLNSLRGSLDIFRLGNVVNVKEVKSANFKNKQNLLSLRLDFDGDGEKTSINSPGIDEEVFEALEAPTSLETLGIYSYKGKTLSMNWMITLTKLRVLTLNNCSTLQFLPPLGKLSSLESLRISWMNSIKIVGCQFLGIKSDEKSVTVFHKLKTLAFFQMENWENWVIRMKGDENITIMPCLHSLSISSCNKLKSIPNHILQVPTLKFLKIDQCNNLNNLYQDRTKISHIPKVDIKE